jgi:hypothetical protein
MLGLNQRSDFREQLDCGEQARLILYFFFYWVVVVFPFFILAVPCVCAATNVFFVFPC